MADQHHIITVNEANDRLDHVLAQQLALSRRQALRLLERGLVRVNDRPVNRSGKGQRLQVGDQVRIEPFTPEEQQHAIAAPQLPLDIAAEGADWLIVNKPAGVAVHPLNPEEDDTLLNAVVARYPHIQGVGEGGLRSGVVHRIDLTTSGVVLFALDQAQWERLRSAFRTHAIRKRYHAIVWGRLEGEARETLPLVIRQHHPARVAVAEPGQKRARQCTLRRRTLEAFVDAAHVEIELETGFLHQIRVMLAYRGHPIIADTAYGGAPYTPVVDRPMLHAQSLAYEDVHGECEPPPDFMALLDTLRRRGRLSH